MLVPELSTVQAENSYIAKNKPAHPRRRLPEGQGAEGKRSWQEMELWQIQSRSRGLPAVPIWAWNYSKPQILPHWSPCLLTSSIVVAASSVGQEPIYSVVWDRAELPLLSNSGRRRGHRIHGIIWADRDLQSLLLQPPAPSRVSFTDQPRIVRAFFGLVLKTSKDADHETCPGIWHLHNPARDTSTPL